MASSSSTSSSDAADSETARAGRGFPWAFVLSIAIVGAVEIALRQVPARSLIAYERGAPNRHAARHHILAYGSAEVSFVGSSRVLSGIVCPEVAKALEARLGRPVAVANFANGGAQIQGFGPLVQHMLRHEPRPRLLLYGVDPEQLRGPELSNDRSPVFWTLSDLWQARTTVDADVAQVWPDVVRNHVGDAYLTLRYRARPLHWLKALHRGRESSPILGEVLDTEHVKDPDRSLVTTPPDAEEVRRHVETVHLEHGRYPFNERKVALFERLVRDCVRRDVRVVFFEMPNAEVFDRFLPPDVYSRFREMMRGIAEREGARFVTLKDMGLRFGDEDFRDPVHLNLRGASRFTRTFSATVVAPELASLAGAPSVLHEGR